MDDIVGTMTALVTPFKDGKVDEKCYERLIQRQINHGIDAVVPVGTTGESATLDMNEHKRCIQIAVDVTKGTNVKVVAGAGANATSEAVELAKSAQKLGADAILSVAPYYNKPSQEGLYQHYKKVAQSIDIPCMLYNVPGRTAVDIEPSTAVRLFENIENIYAIKEATGSLSRTIELLNKAPNMAIISGDDAIDFAMMASGAKGCISVTANILPDIKTQIIKLSNDGQFQKAKELNNFLYPLNEVLFCEANPIPIKAAMYLSGLIDHLEYRLPLTPPSKTSMKLLEEVLKNYKVQK
ncbi:MAG: 4-hydroxy-tetrahydrodipicolinate synthase [Campylobacteraceae bacterium 4484_166]|nr:MAG: 4-hydroxy-tetrahydrodipicolinate synthase [Campylobacteraceae bacterium 4484_166]